MVASERIDARITRDFARGSRIAVLNFNSRSDRFSTYVIDELTAYLVDEGNLRVVDRREIELISGERGFQYSGDVDDASMVSLGRTLGAQFIVSGSLTEIDKSYRIVIRVLNVQTAAVEVQYRSTIVKNRWLDSFFDVEKTTEEKMLTGMLNILLGLGSYLEGDISGGLTITGGYALATLLIVVEVTALDWDSPAVNVPGTLGLGVAGLSLVYGFARPFIYNRSPQLLSMMDNTQFRLVQVPDSGYGLKPMALQLSYSIKF